MCDTIIAAFPGQPVWLAKNSDREPAEAQAVEHHARVTESREALRCTHVAVPGRGARHAVVLSRPAWMWGAEMGVNERGVAIANEAVFTREPVAETGLTGMDLLRLALERAETASEALDVITGLLEAHPQGGRMGYRDRRFRYHSSFCIADREGAWLLETAGRFWAAVRVRGLRTVSNGLTIGAEADRVHPEAMEHARRRGWCRGSDDFAFARCFGARAMTIAAGARARRACTHRLATRDAPLRFEDLVDALTSHDGGHPSDGWRMQMPCAHASWLPTRRAGQTTGSMIARLAEAPQAWLTGTSAPCLSVFKPVSLASDVVGEPGRASERPDDSLWWSAERVHRRAMADYEGVAEALARPRARLQAHALAADDEASMRAVWSEHRAAVDAWPARLPRRGPHRPFAAFWWWQTRRDGLA